RPARAAVGRGSCRRHHRRPAAGRASRGLAPTNAGASHLTLACACIHDNSSTSWPLIHALAARCDCARTRSGYLEARTTAATPTGASMDDERQARPTTIAGRADWMSILALSPVEELGRHWDRLPAQPAFTWIRRPEFGAVMVRGRTSGAGMAFNIGEITVT